MGRTEKLLDKLAQSKSTFNWNELVSLLAQQGYEKREMAGSRVRFYNRTLEHTILLHKPHPENYIKGGALKSLNYKGYVGTIEADLENNILFGKLAYIRDLVTYEAESLSELEKEFRQSVDLYLQDCLELGKEPNKPFKGVFNVRIGEELHREATIIAGDRSLNAFVTEAIQEKIFREKPSLR